VKRTGEPRVLRRLAPSVTAEEARDTRARAWKFIFDCYERKEAASLAALSETEDPDARPARRSVSAK